MRKLKKTLAVLLVLVMALTMIPFASANVTVVTVANFADAADVDTANLMALDVMAAVNVMRGEDGQIFPNRNVTRAEAAVIVARVLLGPDAADQLPRGHTGFRDVDGQGFAFAEGAIAYLHERGIVIGIGDNLFNPQGTVTGAELAVMFLRAVGFGVNGEYAGPRWQTNAVVDGMQWRILTGGADFTAPATRQEVFLYAFNALNTPDPLDPLNVEVGLRFVNWSADRQAYVPVLLQGVVGGAGDAQDLMTLYTRIFWPLPIGLTRTLEEDAFGRPIDRFTLRGIEIGTYERVAEVTFTELTSTAAVNAAISGLNTQLNTEVFINGNPWGSLPAARPFGGNTTVTLGTSFTASANTLTRSDLGAGIATLTGNGVVVQVFATPRTSEIYRITVIRTDIAQVQRSSATAVRVVPVDFDDDDALNARSALFASWSSLYDGTQNDIGPLHDYFADLRELELEDYVLVTPAWLNGAWEVYSIAIPEAVTGTLRAAANWVNASTTGQLTLGEQVHRRARVLSEGARQEDITVVGEDITVLLDEFGFVVHAHGVAAARTDLMIVTQIPAQGAVEGGGIVRDALIGYYADGRPITRFVNFYTAPNPIAGQVARLSGTGTQRTATIATPNSPVTAPPFTSANVPALTPLGTTSSLVANDVDFGVSITAGAPGMLVEAAGTTQFVRFANDVNFFFWNTSDATMTVTPRGDITVPARSAGQVVAIVEYRGNNVAPVISALVLTDVERQGELAVETLRFLRAGRQGGTVIPGGDVTLFDNARLVDITGASVTVPMAVNTDIGSGTSRWVSARANADSIWTVGNLGDQIGTNLGIFTQATANTLGAPRDRMFQIVSNTAALSAVVSFGPTTVFIEDGGRTGGAAIDRLERFEELMAGDRTAESVSVVFDSTNRNLASVIFVH